MKNRCAYNLKISQNPHKDDLKSLSGDCSSSIIFIWETDLIPLCKSPQLLHFRPLWDLLSATLAALPQQRVTLNQSVVSSFCLKLPHFLLLSITSACPTICKSYGADTRISFPVWAFCRVPDPSVLSSSTFISIKEEVANVAQ